MTLPKAFIEVILPFLSHQLTEDDFHDMVFLCYSIPTQARDRFVCKATEAIREFFAEQRRKNNTIYNPYRNISLNQCFSDSNSPASDWLITDDWQEWD